MDYLERIPLYLFYTRRSQTLTLWFWMHLTESMGVIEETAPEPKD